MGVAGGGFVVPETARQREGPPEYSGKMLGSSIQGIQAEYSVGSENKYFSKVAKNHFHKNVCRENVKKNPQNKKSGVFSGVIRVFRRSIQWSNQSIQSIQAEYS